MEHICRQLAAHGGLILADDEAALPKPLQAALVADKLASGEGKCALFLVPASTVEGWHEQLQHARARDVCVPTLGYEQVLTNEELWRSTYWLVMSHESFAAASRAGLFLSTESLG